MHNNIRFDLSDYLIHFFRNVDLDGGNPILLPEHCGFNNIHEDVKIDARYLLRLSLRFNKIFSSWSYRNNRRTIYGESPVVCFTDMPVAAYIETGLKRLKRNENIGLYAIALPKCQMFKIGARPVIYGLDSSNNIITTNGPFGARIIDKNVLPDLEQYRYVTYQIDKIDWTHEREWRWPDRSAQNKNLLEIEEYGVIEDFDSISGFSFNSGNIHGIGIIVPYRKDVPFITNDVLTLIDQEIISRQTFKFIMVLEEIDSVDNLLSPKNLSNHINSCLINFDSYFDLLYVVVDRYQSELKSFISSLLKETIINPHGVNERGKAWVWIADNKSEFTRALLQSKMIFVNKEGRYLIELGSEHVSWPLKEQEEFAKKIANWINIKYNVDAFHFSILNSSDPDDVPYYTNGQDFDLPFYNVSVGFND